jgi:hypothetical protein
MMMRIDDRQIGLEDLFGHFCSLVKLWLLSPRVFQKQPVMPAEAGIQ